MQLLDTEDIAAALLVAAIEVAQERIGLGPTPGQCLLV